MSAGEWIGAIAVLVTLIMGAAAMFRYVLGRVNEAHAETMLSVAELHRRINAVRDEYVRRDDLMTHVTAIERSIGALLAEVQRVHSRIDSLYADGGRPPRGVPCGPAPK